MNTYQEKEKCGLGMGMQAVMGWVSWKMDILIRMEEGALIPMGNHSVRCQLGNSDVWGRTAEASLRIAITVSIASSEVNSQKIYWYSL